MEEVSARPVNIPVIKRDYLTENTTPEIDILEFSACGRYLATRHQLYPTTLWIWDISTDSVDCLLFRNTVTSTFLILFAIKIDIIDY